jgi:hypothetical protein
MAYDPNQAGVRSIGNIFAPFGSSSTGAESPQGGNNPYANLFGSNGQGSFMSQLAPQIGQVGQIPGQAPGVGVAPRQAPQMRAAPPPQQQPPQMRAAPPPPQAASPQYATAQSFQGMYGGGVGNGNWGGVQGGSAYGPTWMASSDKGQNWNANPEGRGAQGAPGWQKDPNSDPDAQTWRKS